MMPRLSGAEQDEIQSVQQKFFTARTGLTAPIDKERIKALAQKAYQKLVDAHQSCQLRPPNRDQVVSFLAKQEAAIKKRFGDKLVDFVVVTEAGKPKVKVRARR